MARGHLFLIVVLLAGAAMAGLLAVTRTSAQSAPSTNGDAAITYRLKRLDRFEASLRRQLAHQTAVPSQAAPEVVYRRPAPVVAFAPRSDDGAEHEHGPEGGPDD